MRFTLDITTRYIDRHLTASMTNNSLTGISSEHPMSIKGVFGNSPASRNSVDPASHSHSSVSHGAKNVLRRFPLRLG
jgi:hypothetical protein